MRLMVLVKEFYSCHSMIFVAQGVKLKCYDANVIQALE